MKKERTIIILIFVLIGLLGVGIFCFAYRPIFSGPISAKHADWEAFGDFFWGLGTMLFTALSVWMLYFVNRQLRKNQEQQQVQHEKFQARIEEERHNLIKEIIHQKRIENYLRAYNLIILKLTGPDLKSDSIWFDLLRKLTIIYKSIIAEQATFPKEIEDKIENINEQIKKAIFQTYGISSSEDVLQIALVNYSLNKDIIDLYFELLALNKVTFDIDFIVPKENKENIQE